MGVFRSQTPRALTNAACNNYCPTYAFHLGRIRPVFMPVSGLFFFSAADYLFRFLLFPVRFNPIFSPGYIPDLRSMAFLPDTILSPNSFPFSSVPTGHSPVLPCIPRSEILYQSISPSTITRICHFHSYILIFLLSLYRSPLSIVFLQGSPVSGPPLAPAKHPSFSGFPTHFRLRIPDFSLSAIYRCVSRSCYKVIKQNCYQRKLSGTPHLSRYSYIIILRRKADIFSDTLFYLHISAFLSFAYRLSSSSISS